jgi:hypothetical protein
MNLKYEIDTDAIYGTENAFFLFFLKRFKNLSETLYIIKRCGYHKLGRRGENTIWWLSFFTVNHTLYLHFRSSSSLKG